jgi:hypothetical protein
MNQGLFATQVNSIGDLLKELKLLRERILYPPYKNLSAANFRHLSYSEIWKKCFQEQIYDFRLADDALLQFRATSYAPLNVSYAYYECPYKPRPTFDEFIEQNGLPTDADNVDDLIREYELIELEHKDGIIPLRYDYSPNQYMRARHPASHVHFGHNNDIRIGTKKILRPLSFMLLIVRQLYVEKWMKVIELSNASTLCRNISESLDEVHEDYWHEVDDWEMHLA